MVNRTAAALLAAALLGLPGIPSQALADNPMGYQLLSAQQAARWERVSEASGVSTHRVRVAGGWLYRVMTGEPAGMALAFVPSGAGPAADSDTAPEERDQETVAAPRLDD